MMIELLALSLSLSLSLSVSVSVTGQAASEPGRDPLSERLAAIESQYGESLVRVRYQQEVRVSTAEPPEQAELTTTGVVVSTRGVVLTSNVVHEPFNQVPHGVGIRFPSSVARAEATISEARIQFADGTEYPATLLGRDPDADVAFFQIELGDRDREFVPVVFPSESEPVAVGEQLVVLSLLPEPLGPSPSVELSRVQAITGTPRKGFVLATGAADPVGSLAIRPSGEVVGFLDALTVSLPDTRSRNPLAFISVMRELPRGVGRGFARPATELADANVTVTEQTARRRGWLGVEMQAVSQELAEHMGLPVRRGILLSYVYSGSPAKKAGLEVGDVLVELEGDPIQVTRDEDIGAFAERILRAGPEADIALGYLREGQRQDTVASLEPAPRSAREAETLQIEELDLLVRELTYDYLATRFLAQDQRGVVVIEPPVGVSSNTNRVAPGDILVRVGDRDVSDLNRLRDVVDAIRSEKPDEVVLFIERGRESFFFAVKPDWN